MTLSAIPQPQLEVGAPSPGPRQPLMGFNHNLRHKNRIYHVQTEDSGLRSPHVYSHVFFKGTIICSAKTDYGELARQADHEAELAELMREQHKALMKRLRRGELDDKITSILGSLEPRDGEEARAGKEFSARLRSYRHAIRHAGRLYAIQTDYYAAVRTDVYHETILIASETSDCRGRATPGGEVVQALAQQQHKRLIKQLREGSFDEKIRSLLGALAPIESEVKPQPRHNPNVPVERYQHQFRYGPRTFTVRSQVFIDKDTARISTELFHHRTLLTNHSATLHDLDAEAATRERLRLQAQEQHKEMLRLLRRGEFDDTIQLLDQMESLDELTPSPDQPQSLAPAAEPEPAAAGDGVDEAAALSA